MSSNCNCEIHKTNGEAPRVEEQNPVQPTPEQPKVELPRPFQEVVSALRYASRAIIEPNGEIYSKSVLDAAAEAMNREAACLNDAYKSHTIRLKVTEFINQMDEDN